MYRLNITKNAERLLEKEIEYSRQNWGVKQASKYKRGLKKAFQELSQNPKIYQVREEIVSHIRIKKYEGSQIVYEISEEHNLVSILAVYGKNKLITTENL